jgi:hypothetical protein
MRLSQSDMSRHHPAHHPGSGALCRARQLLQEFTAWQREDMNRKNPSTTQSVSSAPVSVFQGGGAVAQSTVETMIYPRSRRLHRKKESNDKSRPRRRRVRIVRGGGSNRPILRPELLEQLWARMRDLLGNIKWR